MTDSCVIKVWRRSSIQIEHLTESAWLSSLSLGSRGQNLQLLAQQTYLRLVWARVDASFMTAWASRNIAALAERVSEPQKFAIALVNGQEAARPLAPDDRETTGAFLVGPRLMLWCEHPPKSHGHRPSPEEAALHPTPTWLSRTEWKA